MPETSSAPADWLVAYRPLGQGFPATRTITALYTCADKDKPGWTLFKLGDGSIVYGIRDDVVLDITRVIPQAA